MTTIQVKRGTPAIVLAPMEGVTDEPMRTFMSERGGLTFCVSEFFRISQDVPYARTIAAHVPELSRGCCTPSGIPIQLQFLGGDPDKLAEAAARACSIGARAIDLNFGCPAPTVNRNDGGATLLKYPHRIRAIVAAVRRSVPGEIPVSAKLRLGWDSMDPIHENADMAAQGGASWITIHGRTKTQGYTPPAYWEPIGEVNRRLGIPVVANGEIWTMEDFDRCREQTQCEHFMIGRSALADPQLAHKLSFALGIGGAVDPAPLDWLPLFKRFAELCAPFAGHPNFALCRIKQWMRMANIQRRNPWMEGLKRSLSLAELFSEMEKIR